MAEKSKTLKKKDISKNYSLFILKYWTEHPKKMVCKEVKKGWDPKFNGTYEIIIGMQKNKGGYFMENTPPRASWYVGKEYFERLFEKVDSPDDLRMITKKLGGYIVPNVEYKTFSRKVDGLLKKL